MESLFLHIPKTAGSSISKALQIKTRDSRHTPGKLRHPFDHKTAYTFVRNPWDRAISWHYYFNIKHPAIHCKDYNMPFDEWIRSGCPHSYPNFDPMDQLQYFTNNGVDMVGFIGRFENLAEDTRKLATWLGVQSVPLQMSEVSPRPPGPYQEMYSSETADMLANHCPEFIERFGYTFD